MLPGREWRTPVSDVLILEDNSRSPRTQPTRGSYVPKEKRNTCLTRGDCKSSRSTKLELSISLFSRDYKTSSVTVTTPLARPREDVSFRGASSEQLGLICGCLNLAMAHAMSCFGRFNSPLRGGSFALLHLTLMRDEALLEHLSEYPSNLFLPQSWCHTMDSFSSQAQKAVRYKIRTGDVSLIS
jgi:hypothetical protein